MPIDVEAKCQLAQIIVAYGAAAAFKDVDAVAEATGLTPQQVRKQLAENRANVRKQLVAAAERVQWCVEDTGDAV